MILKLFLKIFLKNTDSYIKAINFNKKTYVVSIEEFKTIDEQLKSVLESNNA